MGLFDNVPEGRKKLLKAGIGLHIQGPEQSQKLLLPNERRRSRELWYGLIALSLVAIWVVLTWR
jgi:hypothetical protein